MADKFGRYDTSKYKGTGSFKPGPMYGKVDPATLGRLERAMLAGAVWLAFQIKKSINRGNRLGDDPSAPGEPPKKVTARLFKSITQAVETSPTTITVKIGTNVSYARFLEGGTSRMSPRPFLRPALLDNRVKFIEVVRRAYKSGTDGASLGSAIESASAGSARKASRRRKAAEATSRANAELPAPSRPRRRRKPKS